MIWKLTYFHDCLKKGIPSLNVENLLACIVLLIMEVPKIEQLLMNEVKSKELYIPGLAQPCSLKEKRSCFVICHSWTEIPGLFIIYKLYDLGQVT